MAYIIVSLFGNQNLLFAFTYSKKVRVLDSVFDGFHYPYLLVLVPMNQIKDRFMAVNRAPHWFTG